MGNNLSGGNNTYNCTETAVSGKYYPCECQFLQDLTSSSDSKWEDGYVFKDGGPWEWTAFCAVSLFFLGLFAYLYSLRNNTAFKARSPKMIFICIALFYIDSMLNTLIYSSKTTADHWNIMCNVDIFVCQVVFYGAAVLYWIRMYRIYRVYQSYNGYLSEQLSKEKIADDRRRSSSMLDQSSDLKSMLIRKDSNHILTT